MARAEVAVLFARSNSIYKSLPGCDVYDMQRDARNFAGGLPIVAHPPCRAWGSLRALAKPAPGERDLAIWAVGQIRKFGGVLEHPELSQLWPEMNLPKPGVRDEFGGFTFPIDQHWFGHRARKRAKLYIVGCEPSQVPEFSLRIDKPSHVVTNVHGLRSGSPGYRPEVTREEREATPKLLAEWLCEVARRVHR